LNKKLLVAGLILFLCFGGIYYARYRIPPTVSFSNLLLKRLDGSDFSSKSLTNQRTIIQFFATWCPDCRRELPKLIEHFEFLKTKKIHLLLISDEPESVLKSFKERYLIPYDIVVLSKSFKEIGIYTLPTTYFIQSDGTVAFQKTGHVEFSQRFVNEQFDGFE